MVVKRIDVLTEFEVKRDGRKENDLRWCQGEVIEVYEDASKPTVIVLWDPLPDIDGGDVSEETKQVLLPTYIWNIRYPTSLC